MKLNKIRKTAHHVQKEFTQKTESDAVLLKNSSWNQRCHEQKKICSQNVEKFYQKRKK